jgi:homoserine dehydrogenase
MTVIDDVPRVASARRAVSSARPRDIRIGLLGVGTVGSAVARLALTCPDELGWPLRITTGLVRDLDKPRLPDSLELTVCGTAVLDSDPDVVIEVLGGLEPARTLVLEALRRRIPVVTANKSLLAHHGEELLDAAALAGVPLRYEAAVVAGVPFLGTFARRPLASRVTSIFAVVNGTSNFVLSQMDDLGCDFDAAVARAQALGFAEPDPSKDVDGIDASEKLTILVRQFFGRASRRTAATSKFRASAASAWRISRTRVSAVACSSRSSQRNCSTGRSGRSLVLHSCRRLTRLRRFVDRRTA